MSSSISKPILDWKQLPKLFYQFEKQIWTGKKKRKKKFSISPDRQGPRLRSLRAIWVRSSGVRRMLDESWRKCIEAPFFYRPWHACNAQSQENRRRKVEWKSIVDSCKNFRTLGRRPKWEFPVASQGHELARRIWRPERNPSRDAR